MCQRSQRDNGGGGSGVWCVVVVTVAVKLMGALTMVDLDGSSGDW